MIQASKEGKSCVSCLPCFAFVVCLFMPLGCSVTSHLCSVTSHLCWDIVSKSFRQRISTRVSFVGARRPRIRHIFLMVMRQALAVAAYDVFRVIFAELCEVF